jgi:L-ascorbate metabolism protein UlaG (beta-lactamase superfamily)
MENFVSTISKIWLFETSNNYASIIYFSVLVNYFWKIMYVKVRKAMDQVLIPVGQKNKTDLKTETEISLRNVVF